MKLVGAEFAVSCGTHSAASVEMMESISATQKKCSLHGGGERGKKLHALSPPYRRDSAHTYSSDIALDVSCGYRVRGWLSHNFIDHRVRESVTSGEPFHLVRRLRRKKGPPESKQTFFLQVDYKMRTKFGQIFYWPTFQYKFFFIIFILISLWFLWFSLLTIHD